MAEVRVERVRKRYSRSGRWVLDGIDATLPGGAVTLVVGGNGSGKTTLLRTVAGASTPSAGRVVRPRGPVGYVPERLPAELRMTARQYVRHMARLRRLPDGAKRAASLFDRLGLRPGPDVPVGELSRGNSQKVALTQALLGPTAVLVLDVQEAVTAVTVGSAARVRLAKLLTAALVCVVLAVVSLVWSPVAGNPSSPRSVLAGAVAHAVTIAAGVAFGALLSRPVVSRLAHVVLGGTALLLLELALPVPPLRPMLGLLGDDHPTHLAGPLAALAAETAALSVALVALAIRVTRQRS